MTSLRVFVRSYAHFGTLLSEQGYRQFVYEYLAIKMTDPLLEQPQILDLTYRTKALRLASAQSSGHVDQRHDIPCARCAVPSTDPQGTRGYNPHSSTMRASSDIRVLVLRGC